MSIDDEAQAFLALTGILGLMETKRSSFAERLVDRTDGDLVKIVQRAAEIRGRNLPGATTLYIPVMMRQARKLDLFDDPSVAGMPMVARPSSAAYLA